MESSYVQLLSAFSLKTLQWSHFHISQKPLRCTYLVAEAINRAAFEMAGKATDQTGLFFIRTFCYLI
jgi:hypothetical protein